MFDTIDAIRIWYTGNASSFAKLGVDLEFRLPALAVRCAEVRIKAQNTLATFQLWEGRPIQIDMITAGGLAGDGFNVDHEEVGSSEDAISILSAFVQLFAHGDTAKHLSAGEEF